MEELTKKQENILNIIKSYIDEFNYSPSLRDIMKLANLKSTSTVDEYLIILENKGYIKRDNNKSRSIELLVPYADSSIINIPIINTKEIIKFDKNLFNNNFNLYGYKVVNDKFNKYNIFKDDLLIVNKSNNFNSNDLVFTKYKNNLNINNSNEEKNTYVLISIFRNYNS